MLDKDKLIHKINLADHVINVMTPAVKMNILIKYDMFFEALRIASQGNVIDNNTAGYKVIFNRVVFLALALTLSDSEFRNYDNFYSAYNKNLSNSGNKQKALLQLYRQAKTRLGGNMPELVTVDEITNVLDLWEVATISEDELGDTDYSDMVGTSGIDTQGILFDDFDALKATMNTMDIGDEDSDDSNDGDFDNSGIGNDDNGDNVDNTEDNNDNIDKMNINDDADTNDNGIIDNNSDEGLINDETDTMSPDDISTMSSDPVDDTDNSDIDIDIDDHSDDSTANITPDNQSTLDISKSEPMSVDEPVSEPSEPEVTFTEEQKKILLSKLWMTKYLIKKQVPADLLNMYLEKRNIANKLKRNQYNYEDRTEGGKGGLYQAAILLSNVHYAATKGVDRQLHFIRNHYRSLIDNNRDFDNKAKIALGMLRDYDTGKLEYDEMPEDTSHYVREFMQMALSNSAKINYSKSNDPSGIDESMLEDEVVLRSILSAVGNDPSVPRDYANIAQESSPLFQNSFEQDPMGHVHINPRGTQHVTRLLEETYYVPSTSGKTPLHKIKQSLYESMNGTSYAFKLRWDMILDAVNSLYPNAKDVTRFAIVGTKITVNNKLIIVDDLLGGKNEIKLEDICNIHAVFARFRYIEQFVIDSPITNCVTREYGLGVQGLQKIFNENKSLEAIGLIGFGDTKPRMYSRQLVDTAPDEVNNELKKHELRMGIESFSAQHNTRLSEKSPGYLHNFFKNSMIQNSTMFGTAKVADLADKSPRVVKSGSNSLSGTISETINNITLAISNGLASFMHMFNNSGSAARKKRSAVKQKQRSVGENNGAGVNSDGT